MPLRGVFNSVKASVGQSLDTDKECWIFPFLHPNGWGWVAYSSPDKAKGTYECSSIKGNPTEQAAYDHAASILHCEYE